MCSGPGELCQLGPNTVSLSCTLQPVASCDDGMVEYCKCGTSGMVFRPDAAAPATQSVLLYFDGVGIDLSMSFAPPTGGSIACFGGPTTSCAIDQSKCAGSSNVYRWSTVPRGPGTYRVRVYRNGTNGPCEATREIANTLVVR